MRDRIVKQAAAVLGLGRRGDDALTLAGALMQAELLARENDRASVTSLSEVEFRVFSQFGEDGILQFLTRRLRPRDVFVELGVADYREACTRLLLVKDNWRGLVVDSSSENIRSIRGDGDFWRTDLTPICSFVTVDNVNDLLERHGFAGELGLLGLDIDGNDYWVWEAQRAADPLIVCVEYNSVFGPARSVVVPYDPAFARTRAHPSNLYWGASLAALTDLAERLGYRLVGSNSAGNNAFFVKAEAFAGLPAPSAAEAWRESRFRESRDADGQLSYLSGRRRLEAIADLPLLDVRSGATIRAAELLDSY